MLRIQLLDSIQIERFQPIPFHPLRYCTGLHEKTLLSVFRPNPLESTLIPFEDKAANDTKNIVAEDISKLQAVGVSDADIVRLCELIAFVAYQMRVAAGLRLMNGAV